MRFWTWAKRAWCQHPGPFIRNDLGVLECAACGKEVDGL